MMKKLPAVMIYIIGSPEEYVNVVHVKATIYASLASIENSGPKYMSS